MYWINNNTNYIHLRMSAAYEYLQNTCLDNICTNIGNYTLRNTKNLINTMIYTNIVSQL